MELYVLSPNLEKLGVIDDYETLLWERQYTKAGDFELEIIPNEHIIPLLAKENILLKNDGTLEAGYINHVSTKKSEGIEVAIVKGKALSGYASRRITLRNQTISANIEKIMRDLVNTNMIEPADTNRRIPNLQLGVDNGKGTNITYNAHYKSLDDCLYDLGNTYGLGHRFELNLNTREIIFQVFEGLDRSINQTLNSRAIFSEEFENLENYEYTTDSSDLKNMVLVAGAGEGAARKTLAIGTDNVGLYRYELFVDARDIEDKKMSGDTEVEIPIEDYNNLLKARCESKLKEHSNIECFTGEIINVDTLIYRQDYDLGDIVTLTVPKWGIVLNTRIVTITENYSSEGMVLDVQFGNNVPDILKKIKRRLS